MQSAIANGMVAALLLAGSTAALAQSVPAADDDVHGAVSDEIVVTAPYARNRVDVLSGTSVLTGADLAVELRPTIGETLARQPGVSATSFGPNASRPVLRGFQGDRIRVLTDGIGSFDVSTTSVDHAVAINPLTADRVEVLRGPAVLLFGSSAVGGVVNVIDSRIPRTIPEHGIHVDVTGGYGSAADEWSAGGRVDVPVGDKLVFHVDGSYVDTSDLDIGGYVLTPELRAEAAASGDPEIEALADLRDTLPNSAARTWDLAGGLSLITERGSLGFSVSYYDSLYGVPVRYALEPGGEAEAVRLDVEQTRADLRAEIDAGDGFLDQIKLRFGWADYQHSELEETGEVGTTFFSEGYEGRLELVQSQREGWLGASGVQLLIRDFDVVGEEAFVPRNSTVQVGLFTLQSFEAGPVKAEAGLRYENSQVDAKAGPLTGGVSISRSFDTVSGSLGGSIGFGGDWRVGLNGSYSERAPSAEELYSNGPHAGTQAFEIGDPSFGKESSWGIEAVLRGSAGPLSLDVAAFYSRFDDFIYETDTGAIEDDLPVFQYLQADAEYYGIEVDVGVKLFEAGGFTFAADGIMDVVRATILDEGPAPRIPPLRLLGGLEARSDRVQGRVEVEWADEQDRVTTFETPTDSFTLVNASVSVRPFGADNATSIILSANNIFDVTARRHSSFLKDYAPLAGRDIRVGLRASF